jgi:uncharacterized protein YjbI with pentapeptide repeats
MATLAFFLALIMYSGQHLLLPAHAQAPARISIRAKSKGNARSVPEKSLKATSIEGKLAADADLQQAQIANARAQAEYYKIQTEKAKKPSLWDRFAGLSTLLAALVAASVALISFRSNYKATLFSQQDTQFYEALKRFGDKDSPAIRASAAGLLAELGSRTRLVGAAQSVQHTKANLRFWRLPGRKRVYPFLRTALDQLAAGLLLEGNPVVVLATQSAFAHLLALDPDPWVRQLYKQNLTLQKELAKALADFAAESNAVERQAIPDQIWDVAAAATGYRRVVLETLAARFDDKANQVYLGRRTFGDYLATSQGSGRGKTGRGFRLLGIVAARLRNNVGAWSAASNEASLPESMSLPSVFLAEAEFGPVHQVLELNIPGAQLQDIHFFINMPRAYIYQAHLQGADIFLSDLRHASLFNSNFEYATLRDVDLRNADLQHSSWKGAQFHDCNLGGAKLYGVKIDTSTSLLKTNWWAADFSSSLEQIDTALLEKLYKRVLSLQDYESLAFFGQGTDLSNWLNGAHPSVRNYVEERQNQDSGT